MDFDPSKIGGVDGVCYQTREIWRFVGYAVLILKILIPAVLIVLGIVALGKAVISADDKEVKGAINGLIRKFITAVLIFFIPSIVSALFSAVNGFKTVKDDYMVCVNCITSPRVDSKCPPPDDEL